MTNLLGYALTSDEPTPGWRWLMRNTREVNVIKSQTTKEVQKEADALLAAVAKRVNIVSLYGPLTAADVRSALAGALAERLGEQGRGVVIIWWEAGEVQINVAGTR